MGFKVIVSPSQMVSGLKEVTGFPAIVIISVFVFVLHKAPAVCRAKDAANENS